jgi:type VI secretion system protein ImpI
LSQVQSKRENRVPSLTLSIQNMDRLPDGGPLQINIKGQRGLDIGRDQYLDWTLPDPGRIVSSRHCEVRFRDGGYWLHDVSSNGTFVNGSELRMAGPHRLKDGDRVEIGHYIIGVKVEDDAASLPPPQVAAAPAYSRPEEMWDSVSTAPPISAAELRPPRPAAEQNDLMNWYVDIPQVDEPPRQPAASWLPPAAPPSQPAPAAAPREPSIPPFPVPAAEQPGFDALPPMVAPSAMPRADWSITPLPEPPEPARPPQSATTTRPGGYMTQPPAAIMAEIARNAAPPPAPPPEPAAAASGAAGPSARVLAARMARGAGVAEDVFSHRSPEEMAELTGLLLRITCENVKQMLQARAETKGLVRSTNQTMIQALENNPLKFSPTVEDALRTMFGPATTSYLDARRALEDSFRDLKTHQMNTYGAMQQALKMVVEDLDPAAVETATDKDGGIGGLMGSRKAKLWDTYVTRWKAKTERHDNGLVDAFMLYFSECYDRLASKLRA